MFDCLLRRYYQVTRCSLTSSLTRQKELIVEESTVLERK